MCHFNLLEFFDYNRFGATEEAVVKAVLDATNTDGVRYQIDFGHEQTALISEWQIVKDN